MTSATLLLLLAKTTLVLVAALGITRVLQRASAGARHLVWLATLAALLLVPAVAVWSPLRLHVLPPATADGVRATPPSASRDDGGRDPFATDLGTIPDGEAVPRTVSPVARPDDAASPLARLTLADAATAALALWALVALAIGGALARSWLAARRIVRRAQPLDGAGWLDPLYEVSDRLDLEEPPRLLRSEDAKMPFACGVRRPTIVLPAESDAWTLDRRRAVLLHELAHVRRRDLAGHTLARLVCAAYWFHPLVWTAARRLRAESELACDDLALACGARPADYAEHLLDIVTSVRRDATPVVALAMARRSEFEGRMLAILDPERPRATPSRRQATTLVGALMLVAVLVGAAAPAPTADLSREIAAATRGDVYDVQDPAASARAPLAAPRPLAAPAPMPEPRPRLARAARPELPADPADPAELAAPSAPAEPSGAAGAVRALAAHGDGALQPAARDERVTLLARVLRGDSSASLRRIAAWGLGEYAEQPAASAALAAALRGDANERVREMAAWALAQGDESGPVREALVAALRRDADERVRATAAWALGMAGDRTSIDALVGALDTKDEGVRRRAIWAIGSLQPERAPAALVAQLGDPQASVRRLAAWALYEIEDPSTIPALQRAMRTDTNEDTRIAYVRALAAMGDRSVDALRELLESSEPRVKEVAVRALAGGRAGGPWPWPWPEPRPSP